MKQEQKIKAIEAALQEVKDPEIPVISVLELGIITAVDVIGSAAKITMTPTFTGCPAIDYMKQSIRDSVAELDFVEEVEVKVDFSVPWSSNRISEAGKQKIKEFGLAPPKKYEGEVSEKMLKEMQCPNCESQNTTLNTLFGPTLCRSIHLCYDCKETFEAFKPV